MGEDNKNGQADRRYILPALILSFLLIAGAVYLNSKYENVRAVSLSTKKSDVKYSVVLSFSNLSEEIAESGVIDKEKFLELYHNSGRIPEASKLFEENTDFVEMNSDNSDIVLNFLWALGLGQKSKVYEEKLFANPETARSMASTGGWTLARGDAVEHLGRHNFLLLTADQEILVEKIAKNIYRPCCNNPASMPDCNHGMAMLGLIELLVSQEKTEEEIYDTAAIANTFWFPDHYKMVNAYLNRYSTKKTTSKEILGYSLSSGSGAQNIIRKMNQPQIPAGSSCSV